MSDMNYNNNHPWTIEDFVYRNNDIYLTLTRNLPVEVKNKYKHCFYSKHAIDETTISSKDIALYNIRPWQVTRAIDAITKDLENETEF